MVYLGVEAGVQRHLDLYHKGTAVTQCRQAIRIIKESGADLKMEFILFNPWITFSELKETIQFLEEMGVYDPYILTSNLTIMKETDLAREVEAGRLPVISPPDADLADFDRDSFIPYLISDYQVRALHFIVSGVLIQFEHALYSIYRLHNLLRVHRKSLPEEMLKRHQEEVQDYRQLINETSLDLFKRAMGAVEARGPMPNPEAVMAIQGDLIQETLDFMNFLIINVIQAKEQELRQEIHESQSTA